MPELTTADVEQYTGGRLDKDHPETISLLARGLGAARRFCGWHVTPVQTDTDRVLDGPGSRLLRLPTLRLNALTAVTEDGTELDMRASDGIHLTVAGAHYLTDHVEQVVHAKLSATS